MTKFRFIAVSIFLGLVSLTNAYANNTSGVHGPKIDPNDKSAMYRLSFVPGEDGADDAFAHRFHYQQAINESYRWRVIGQVRERNGSNEYDYLRAELLWYLKPQGYTSWDSGVRFDIRTRRGSRPEQFGINWTNQWNITDKWQARGIVIGQWQFGSNATTGTILETRGSLKYSLDSGEKVGVEMFSDWGKLTDMGSWSEQEHQLGPVVSGKLGEVKYQVGYLAGISQSADDHDFRLWFSKKF